MFLLVSVFKGILMMKMTNVGVHNLKYAILFIYLFFIICIACASNCLSCSD